MGIIYRDHADAEYAGATSYPSNHRLYDFVVYEINCRFGWGVRRRQIEALYLKFAGASDSHCEVGLASPSFVLASVPKHCAVLLVDVDSDWLEKGKATMSSLGYTSVEILRHDVTAPVQPWRTFTMEDAPRHRSLGINFVFHCIPGRLDISSKGMAFQHLKVLLEPDGVLFGSTILGDQHMGLHTAFGRIVMNKFNNSGVFGNRLDNVEDLRASLEHAFRRYEVALVGAVAVFAACDDPDKDLRIPLGQSANGCCWRRV